ncbi:hypothetical protein [Lysinibacillus sp. 54212]|uniref:hypothetical protein n=1 Tax=Lysinibacillus sp. 54212 TaxID=3119829 RepID=UPI002FC94066
MAKILEFPSQKDDVVAQLEYLLQMAKEGEFKRFVFAAELNRKELPEDDLNLVATSYINSDIGHRQYLLAHLQADITLALVKTNFIDG